MVAARRIIALWVASDQHCLTVLDTNDQFTTAFTSAGLGYLKQLVSDHKK